MKKILLLILAVSIPFLLSFKVWQAFRYAKLKDEVLGLEREQTDWLEKNKKVIASLALWGSPERIEKLASETLRLKRLEQARTLKIKLPGGKGF